MALNLLASRWGNLPQPMTPKEGALDTYQKYKFLMFRQQKVIYRYIAREISRSECVLEVGCGVGVGTAFIHHHSHCQILGTDLEQENIALAKELYPWVDFLEWDARQPSPKNWKLLEFDVVVAVEMLEHTAQPSDVLLNLIDLAQEVVWISTPNGRAKVRPPENPLHVLEYTPKELVTEIMDHKDVYKVDVLNWETFERITNWISTDISPLVYRIEKKSSNLKGKR